MNKVKYLFLCLLLTGACNNRTGTNSKGQYKEIPLQENVKIVVPVSEKEFSASLTFSHIEIWIGSEQAYIDTSLTEYLFDEKQWPQARKLKNGEYEILVKIFDAPDFNKLWALYFRDGKLIRKTILPFFEKEPKDFDNDDIKEYEGIMNVIDAYENSDSCYYNPTLYYEITDSGILLDTSLTKKKIIENWGAFYGYEQSDKTVLPCGKKK